MNISITRVALLSTFTTLCLATQSHGLTSETFTGAVLKQIENPTNKNLMTDLKDTIKSKKPLSAEQKKQLQSIVAEIKKDLATPAPAVTAVASAATPTDTTAESLSPVFLVSLVQGILAKMGIKFSDILALVLQNQK